MTLHTRTSATHKRHMFELEWLEEQFYTCGVFIELLTHRQKVLFLNRNCIFYEKCNIALHLFVMNY